MNIFITFVFAIKKFGISVSISSEPVTEVQTCVSTAATVYIRAHKHTDTHTHTHPQTHTHTHIHKHTHTHR